MSRLDLDNVNKWIGEESIKQIHKKRLEKGELKRQRKLGSSELLWLFLNVAVYSGTKNLHEILKLTLANLNCKWSISVPAFCKARKRFSPSPFVFYLGTSGKKT